MKGGFLIKAIGFIVDKLLKAHSYYMTQRATKEIGGGNKVIQYPYQISGIHNIECGDYVDIGKNAVIMTTRAKVIIKQHFVAGPRLTIITGDHLSEVGKFIDTVSDSDKDKSEKRVQLDQDVIIDEDVWCGANVTILKGVHIGRGCIIAANACVNRSMPPYCIVAGIPAKPIRRKWDLSQILKHEEMMYSRDKRLSLNDLEYIP